MDLFASAGVDLPRSTGGGRRAPPPRSHFAAFRAEAKRAFRDDIPVRERGEWEAYLRENAQRVHSLSGTIATAEREIDRIVYALFDLTTDEIALLEASLKDNTEPDRGGLREAPTRWRY